MCDFAGPYTVLTPEAPVHYRSTWITLICSMSIVIVISLGLRVYFVRENARRDTLYGSPSETPVTSDGTKSAEGEKADGDDAQIPVL